MSQHWDEFSKSLAEESLPRRESLRLLGAALAGAVLSPLGLGTAWGAGNPCKDFCRCSNKWDQQNCLKACRACGNDPRRLCGSCGSYACCGGDEACCGERCIDLDSDFNHCGGCGNACERPDFFEEGACIFGECVYVCVEGAVDCDGVCTPVDRDPNNCGACGNVCDGATPYCDQGECSEHAPVECPPGGTWCRGACRDLRNSSTSCGTSCENAVVCGQYETCINGRCEPVWDSWE